MRDKKAETERARKGSKNKEINGEMKRGGKDNKKTEGKRKRQTNTETVGTRIREKYRIN